MELSMTIPALVKGLLVSAAGAFIGFWVLFLVTVPFYGMSAQLPLWLNLTIGADVAVMVISGTAAAILALRRGLDR
jgi:hypothetical protein